MRAPTCRAASALDARQDHRLEVRRHDDEGPKNPADEAMQNPAMGKGAVTAGRSVEDFNPLPHFLAGMVVADRRDCAAMCDLAACLPCSLAARVDEGGAVLLLLLGGEGHTVRRLGFS
jgi:hypothetical protein